MNSIAQLLDQTNLSYTKVADGVWSVTFTGNEMSNVTVLIFTIYDDEPERQCVILQTTIAEKGQIDITPKVMAKLLRFNIELDRAKIGINGDGDIVTRIDLTVRILDAQELEENLEQVAAVADKVYGKIGSYMEVAC